MKKIFGWIVVIGLVVMISFLYHDNIENNFEDTVVDDIDMEDIIEIDTFKELKAIDKTYDV